LPTLYRNDRYWRTLNERELIVTGRKIDPRAFFFQLDHARYPDSGYDEVELQWFYSHSECMRREGVEAFSDPVAGFEDFGWPQEDLEQARRDPDFDSALQSCLESGN
jgi:hypothetical protein